MTDGALVLFSGGQDSTACLAWALSRHERVETLGFDYGQRHAVELEARRRVRERLVREFPQWAARLGEDHTLDIRSFGAIGETAMTSERAIEITGKGLPSTYVPGRNLVFLTYAAAFADRRRLKVLVGGMCETDFSGYPDCRRATLDAMEQALNLGMAQDFRIDTPLMHLTKAETWALAKQLGGEPLVAITVEESHTCYLGERGTLHPWGHGCGTCPACELRRKGYDTWVEAGRPAL
ncbi:7-cyano-7-deazaguanine synthase QueC [Phenylobacterium sp.]|uniref:7-cyano-7-deazaguanine synthase QueC n=1 Tax=Phenylobacterium sp. TaxID=1871053 RepID=UPI0025D8FE63|nr:7-cyano-7-deazaguanine synthase QueC [Phenylobacterium sp.]MBX3483306.1 7-cyano-7-deazaguanine synthase QueC [Phenylobacterium sp.]